MKFNVIIKDNRIIGLEGEPIDSNKPIIELDSIPDDLFDGCYKLENGQIVKDTYQGKGYENLKQQLRVEREMECFNIINRGQLWYESLTSSQQSELKSWYQKWLDVTETLAKPEKLSWL